MTVQTILSRGCFGAAHTGRMAGVPITCERRMHFNMRGVWGAVAVVCCVVGGRCIARHQGKRTGRMQAQGERSRPRGRRPHEAEARPLGGTEAGGAGQHCVQSAGVTGGPSEATTRQGRAGQGSPVTRGEANKVSRAPERLGWRCAG